jgi:hypothetical protein
MGALFSRREARKSQFFWMNSNTLPAARRPKPHLKAAQEKADLFYSLAKHFSSE